jgi:hypothetical protein
MNPPDKTGTWDRFPHETNQEQMTGVYMNLSNWQYPISLVLGG